jgi:AbrB family looped-hinge helix DNA binding protein
MAVGQVLPLRIERWIGFPYPITHGTVCGMDVTITMDSAGRIVLPKTVRELLHLRGGAKLMLKVSASKIELSPEADDQVQVTRRGDRLVIVGTPKGLNAAEAIQADREDQDRQFVRRVRRSR